MTGNPYLDISALDSSLHVRAFGMWQDWFVTAGGGQEQSATAAPLPTAAANTEPQEMSIPRFLLEGSIVVSAVVTLLTNFSVLLCFTQSAELRRHVPGIFILNLSISNILLALINMPATFLGVASGAKPLGEPLCRAVSFTETFTTCNAMLSMAALSVDRWVAVVFPLRYSSKMRHRDALVIVSYSWLHSLAFSLVQLAMGWGTYSHTYASCTLYLDEEETSHRSAYAAFTVLFHCSSFALCLFILCFAYLKVLRVARSHCKRIDVITVQALLLLVDIHPSVKERCLAQQRKRRQRAAKKICIFIGSFIICFSPYVITRLAELLPSVVVSRHWGVATKCLVYAKASCDPFVYCLLRHQYRKVLVSTIYRIRRKDQYFLSAYSTRSMWNTTDENFPEKIT